MRLAISYSFEDEATAREIGALCAELGIDHVLDGRNDWLMNGLHAEPAGSTHLLLVVSRATDGSWWMPFRLGRATERGLPVVPYLGEAEEGVPEGLWDADWVRGMDDLRKRLTSLGGPGQADE
jgi:hypothetical protein